MYCNNCGKHVPEDSKFCQHCGSKLGVKQQTQKTNTNTEEPVSKTKVDILWDKFVEVYDAKDDDRRRFDALSSPHAKELLERLAINGFESFIKDNKDELNKQTYKTIEALKNVYKLAAIGGYRLWLAEALVDDKEELNKFNSFSLDKFIDTWKEYDFDKALKSLSEEMGICITRYNKFRFDNFMDATPEAKELPNAVAEKLQTALLFQVAYGYDAGKVENKFRKQ